MQEKSVRRLASVLIGIAVLGLVGCSAVSTSAQSTAPEQITHKSSSLSAPAQSPQPTATGSRTYSSAVELRDAAVAAGANCDSWKPGSVTPGVIDGGVCNGQIGISITENVQARNHILELNPSSSEGQPFLVGSNWLYTDQSESGDPMAAMKSLEKPLGGVLWQPKDPTPAT